MTGLALAIQVMDASCELIAIRSLAGRFIAVNRAFRAATALGDGPIEELVDRQLFDDEGARALSTSEHLAVLTGSPVPVDVPVRWSGQPQLFHAVCTPWVDGGRRQGVIVTGTCQGPAGTESEQPAARLAADIGSLAHRFNNALTTVVGLSDWHLLAGQVEGPLRDDFRKIRDAATAAEQAAREIQRLTSGAVRPAVTSSQPQRDQPSQPLPSGARVLLVDDQPEVRTSLSVMIRTLGYDVHAVDSGPAALAWLDRQPADLVITDYGMPHMNGRELASAIAARPERPKVVLLTGWSDGTPECEPPVIRVLAKPLRMGQLREALTSLIGSPDAA